jgi:hypothetical protein
MNFTQVPSIIILLVTFVLGSCGDGGSGGNNTISDDSPPIDTTAGRADFAGFIDINYPGDWTVDVFPDGVSVVDENLPFDATNIGVIQVLTVGVSSNSEIVCAGQRVAQSSPFATVEGFLAGTITLSESNGARFISVSDTQVDERAARELAFATVLSNGVEVSGLAIIFSLEAIETTIERHVDFYIECITSTTSFTTNESLIREILSSVAIR